MAPHVYATDLTDAEWVLLQPLPPPDAPTGRPRVHALRTIVNAIFYVLRTGCAWRFLPQEWPVWPTVCGYFRRWRRDGTWERIHRTLRQRLRLRLHRDPHLSAGSIDGQKDIPLAEIDWSKYLPSPGFHVIPRRWVVERTFAWFAHNRRLSKDYERLCATSEAWIYLTMIRLMLRRLARLKE
jgi:putative transposase